MSSTAQEATEIDVDLDLLEPTAEEKLDEFFSGLGAEPDIKISINEIDPDNRQRRGFLFYVLADQIEPDDLLTQILERYGPGEYEASAKNAAGHFKFKQRFVLGSIKKKSQAIPGPAAAQLAAPVSPGLDPNVIALLDGQQKILEAMALAMKTEPAPTPPTIIEQAKELASLKELFAPPPASNNLLSMIKDLRVLREEFGENGATDPLSKAVESFIPAITKAVERMDSSDTAARGRAYRTAQDLAGAGTPATPPPVARAPMSNDPSVIIGMYLSQILSLADAGAEPAEAAEQVGGVVNSLPDDGFTAMINFLEADDAVSKLAEINPHVNDHSEWFGKLIAAVLALFPAEDQAAPLAEPAAIVVDSEIHTPAGAESAAEPSEDT